MYHKVIVLEIKKDYLIVMNDEGQVMKIQPKQDLSVGDKIYVLEEDIIKEEASKPLFSITPFAKQMVGLLAVCLLFVAVWKINDIEAYALISVDGNQSVQLEVDKQGKVKQATSKDGSYGQLDLARMRGKTLDELELDDIDRVSIKIYEKIDDDEFEEDVKEAFGANVEYVVDDDDVEEDNQNVDEQSDKQEEIKETTEIQKIEDEESDSSKQEVVEESKDEDSEEAKEEDSLQEDEEVSEEDTEETEDKSDIEEK